MNGAGLVLEGGGMRGVYTAGVLDSFAEQNLYFPYIIGVSAGACMAASYLSRQIGRNREVNVGMISDPRYLSWRNYWRNRELFGMDFVFDEIPNVLIPYDYEAFMASLEQFVIGTTDCETGEPVYYDRSLDSEYDLLTLLRASSSLPFIAPIVEYGGKKLLDGGIVDPIPIRKAEQDGYRRNVVILTRNADYRKSPNRFAWMARRAYGKYPKLIEAMQRRHDVYNATLEHIQRQEERGEVFVIRPQQQLTVGRMERNPAKLDALYNQGCEDGQQVLSELRAWLER
ncbi:patatin family protein [Paenibacillus sp. GCM10023252]|uniref:patatin-like phospholipase family protein n=1 Tax=Paenibacillus sp. GCM10023252 TaxID=3252649 RepID=UPI00361A5BE0